MDNGKPCELAPQVSNSPPAADVPESAVTAAMNRVLADIEEPVDPFVLAAARRTLERVEWDPD